MRLVRRLAVASVLAWGCGDDPSVASPAAVEPQGARDDLDSDPAAGSESLQAPGDAGHNGVAPSHPTTTLPVTLLATLAAPEQAQGRATLRDRNTGVIATYRVGEQVGAATITAVEPDRVVFSEADGESSALRFDVGTAKLEASDVYYPDLADDDELPTSMADAIELTSGPGFVVKNPAHAWGTPRTVSTLRQALRAFNAVNPGDRPVNVGDLSLRGGGPFPPHLSHQHGRDADIGYVHNDRIRSTTRFVSANRYNLDTLASWRLVKALLDTEAVRYIFMDYELQALLYEQALASGADPDWVRGVFQYPGGRGVSHGLIRHWRGHRNHFHVRFWL